MAPMPVKNVKFSQLFALAEKKPRLISDRRAKNWFISSALVLNHVTTIRSFNVVIFLGFWAWEDFLLWGGKFNI